MLTKLTRGNQITIPKTIIEKAHLKSGTDYLDVEYRAWVIYLKPVEVEERIAPEILDNFQKQMFKRDKEDVLINEKEAEGYLLKRTKRKR